MIEICPTEHKIISVDGHLMIEVKITEQMRENALYHVMKDKEKFGGGNYTIADNESDKGMFVGSLGEEVVSSYFNTKLEYLKGNYMFDIIINQELVEVKSQNIDKGIPRPRYELNIPSPSNICDRYIFVFIHGSYTKGWIVGTCTREEFEDKSYIAYANIKDRKPKLIPRIKIKDLEDVVSWQLKLGRTAKVNGSTQKQADL